MREGRGSKLPEHCSQSSTLPDGDSRCRHNPGRACLCRVCALACAHWLTERGQGVGLERGRGGRQTEGVAAKKQQGPSPRVERTCPSLWQERASVVTGPRSETGLCGEKDTGAAPTNGHTYTQGECLLWQCPETGMGGALGTAHRRMQFHSRE